jgi:hypothetical protein
MGFKPDDVRDMMPRDWGLCVQGWNESNGTEQPGADAPTLQEYRELVRRVDVH